MQKHFSFVSNFEHIKFSINGKYSNFFYDNPNYYVSFVIFQTYKNEIFFKCPVIWVALWPCFFPHACQQKVPWSKYLQPYFRVAIHQLKHFSIFSYTKWWWILICFVRTWNTKFFDKYIQLWFSSYMTMGFIYGTPMLPKSYESHFVCIVACEAAIYLAYIDDITINVCFLLFEFIAPFQNKKT